MSDREAFHTYNNNRAPNEKDFLFLPSRAQPIRNCHNLPNEKLLYFKLFNFSSGLCLLELSQIHLPLFKTALSIFCGGHAHVSPWLQIWKCSYFLILNNLMFAKETTSHLFVLCQQNIKQTSICEGNKNKLPYWFHETNWNYIQKFYRCGCVSLVQHSLLILISQSLLYHTHCQGELIYHIDYHIPVLVSFLLSLGFFSHCSYTSQECTN